jgi:CRISPR-associated protein (TIGR03985 family)
MSNLSHLHPHIPLLQWLARGSLKQNLLRAVRLWVWLQLLYGDDRLSLLDPFTFSQWRDATFSPTHPKTESPPLPHDPHCRCAKTTAHWLFESQSSIPEAEWRQALQQHDRIPTPTLNELLQRPLFAVTRRTLFADLQILTELGWLQRQDQQYFLVQNFPLSPADTTPPPPESAFLHPDLAAIAASFSQPIGGNPRFFLEVDYIVSNQNQDRVEDWQEKLKHWWNKTPIPPIRLTYSSARVGKTIPCIVYPICIYYIQRAVYLCTFGQTPTQQGEWYNYRLDRIQSMTALRWSSSSIPTNLQHRYQNHSLPHPDYIQEQMSKAWGFDFYQPTQLMLLRFDRTFHDRYIQGTFRHETFQAITYPEAKRLIRQYTHLPEQTALLEILAKRSPTDAYYQAQYRTNDTNVELRLRSWRPQSEVLLPWGLRQVIAQEAIAEAKLYQG